MEGVADGCVESELFAGAVGCCVGCVSEFGAGFLFSVLLVCNQFRIHDRCGADRLSDLFGSPPRSVAARCGACCSHAIQASASRQPAAKRGLRTWRVSSSDCSKNCTERSVSPCRHTAIPMAHSEYERYTDSPHRWVMERTRSWHSTARSVSPDRSHAEPKGYRAAISNVRSPHSLNSATAVSRRFDARVRSPL